MPASITEFHKTQSFVQNDIQSSIPIIQVIIISISYIRKYSVPTIDRMTLVYSKLTRKQFNLEEEWKSFSC